MTPEPKSSQPRSPEEKVNRFVRFTEDARRVCVASQREANRLNHNYIGTEHLLLGLVAEEDNPVFRILDRQGVTLGKVRSAVEFIIGRGDKVYPDISLTPRAQKVMELAEKEADRLGSSVIGSEHIALGLIKENEGVGAGVLESLGVNLERLRGLIEKGIQPTLGKNIDRLLTNPELPENVREALRGELLKLIAEFTPKQPH